MEPRILHALELTTAIAGQTIFLCAAWGFLCAVLVHDPLIASDTLAAFIVSKQTQITWSVTLLATIFSVASTTFLTIALKAALRHRMHKPISLIELSAGISLARGSFIISFRHPITGLVTLAAFGVTKLLVSSWASLLTPIHVTSSVNVSGWELDLTSSWFESTLQQELVLSGAALVRGNSTEILNLDGVLSGIAAAKYSVGPPGIFDFNGVHYNVSTGGILPAVQEYAGTSNPVSGDEAGLAFSGGQVPTHLNVSFPRGQTRQGLQHSFTLVQQGLTANVTCQRSNFTADNMNYTSSFVPIPVPLANGTTDYWLWTWNITANCDQGQPAQQQYVTRSNSSIVPPSSSSGFLSLLVCPYPLRQSDLSWERFTVISNARWRYSFLPFMTCSVNPLITTSHVNYTNGVINATLLSSQPLGNSNPNLAQFLAAFVNRQWETTQYLTTNAIGDALYAIYMSEADSSTSEEDVINLILSELEHYWQGVIEFSGTFLRSAFSVSPSNIPPEARIPLRGYEIIGTLGWYRTGYTVIPITVVALMMYAAVAYTLWHVFIERGHESFTMFDPSNPIHLMMVSSTRDRNDVKDNLDDWLASFVRGGIGSNERLRVQLTTVDPLHKRFAVRSMRHDSRICGADVNRC